MINESTGGDGLNVEKKGLEQHDARLKTVWEKVEKKLEYHPTPLNQEQKLENKFYTIFYIGEKLKVPANGLSGYHAHVVSESSETKEQNARRNMVSVIKDGLVKPAWGYTSDLNPHIDKDGNLINGNEQQAFCAPLRMGSYFDSAGNFGPYWVIFQPGTAGADRKNGIPADFHKYYLVPDETDKKLVAKQALDRGADENSIKKIVTYDEFIELNKTELPANWAEEKEKAKEHEKDVYLGVGKLRDQVKQLTNWEEGIELYLKHITDSNEDPLFRTLLAKDIDLFPDWFRGYKLKAEEVLVKVKDPFLKIINDRDTAEELRKSCLYKLRGEEKFLNKQDKDSLLHLAQDKSQTEGMRFALVDILKDYREKEDINKALVDMASDPEERVSIRHNALFKLQGSEKEVTDTFLRYLKEGNEQGKKIAMYKLTGVPLFDPQKEILQAVDVFARENKRADTFYYINKFLDKFSYVIQPDAYKEYVPKSWDDFKNKTSLLSGDIRYGGDNRDLMKRGLLVYALDAVRHGEIKLTGLTNEGASIKDIILFMGERNDIGVLTDLSDGMTVYFGGWGISGSTANPLSERKSLRKLAHEEDRL